MSSREINPELLRALYPLVRRAANFGPYYWLAILASWLAFTTVGVVAPIGHFVIIPMVPVSAWLIHLSIRADRERVIECWLREVK